MPAEVVSLYEAKCKAGKKTYRKCADEEDCHAYGECVAAIVKTLIDKRRSAKGGTIGGTLTGVANYSQIPAEGGTAPHGDGTWVTICDPDTRLLTSDGRSHLVDPTAHLAALTAWTSHLYDIDSHIDHKPEKGIKIDIKENKFDIDKGLMARVLAEDPEIQSKIDNGTLLPSIVVRFPEEDVDDEGIHFYLPSALDWMWEGVPQGDHVGPDTPSPDALPALGGTIGGQNMPEGTTPPAQAPAAAPPTAKTTEPVAPAAPPAKPKEGEPAAKPPEGTTPPVAKPPESEKTEIEKLREENEKLKREQEVLLKSTSDKDHKAEESLRKIYLERVPEKFRDKVKGAPIDELERYTQMWEHVQEQIAEGSKEVEEKLGELFPKISEKDEVAGAKMSAKKYNEVLRKEYANRGQEPPQHALMKED